MYQLRLLVGHGVSYIQIGEKAMATKEKGRTFDGITRPSNDLYSKEWNRIFNPVAKEVRTSKFKSQVVKPKKGKGSFKRENGCTQEIN